MESIHSARENQSLYSALFKLCEFGLIIIDQSHRIVDWNEWLSRSSAISRDRVIGETLEVIFPNIQNSRLVTAIDLAIEQGISSFLCHSLNRNPIALVGDNENPIAYNTIVKPVAIADDVSQCAVQLIDVSSTINSENRFTEQTTRLNELADNLRQEKERAQITLRSIADGVITTDTDGRVVSMNRVAEKITGWQFHDALNKPVSQIFSVVQEDSAKIIANPVSICLEKQTIVSNDQDLLLVDKEGQEHAITESAAPIEDEDGQLIGAILVFSDVSQSRELAAQLKWQAKHDPLTGLVNRREFESAVDGLIAKDETKNSVHSLLYIDLDQFKVVNDTCGHTAGDELLRNLAVILQQKLRSQDILARLGGDEFCILLFNCNKENALRLANLIKQEVQDFRFRWEDKTFCLGISIGLVEITGVERSVEEILSAADSACYVAKDTGRNRVHVHENNQPDAPAHHQEMQWIARLQSALDNDRFCLYAQRIAQIARGGHAGDHYEVLIRMLDESDNLIPPGAFIPAAERFNLMPKIDQWVIRKLFESIKAMDPEQQNDLPLFSVNLSGASLSDEHFLSDIKALLSRYDIPTNRLCFEITETAAIANLAQANRFMLEIKKLGCYFSLDDFGSGLSSFGYLKNMPVDYLKIDGHFVKDIVHDPIDRAFVESINQIGHVMGLTTIAEFVENDIVLEMLKEVGVDYAQGYGIDRPKEFSELFKLTKP